MDLQDFDSQLMYFDLPQAENVTQLIQKASEAYSEGGSESYLQSAYEHEPENLSVLVALYRFYYYQHRLKDAIAIAAKAMAVVAPKIGFPAHWESLRPEHLPPALKESFTSVRFYLLALKGSAYMNLRLGNMAEGVSMLNKVIELDSKDRLGAKALLRAMGPATVYSEPQKTSQQMA